MSYLIREQAIEYGFQNRLKNWRQKVDHRGIDFYHIFRAWKDKLANPDNKSEKSTR